MNDSDMYTPSRELVLKIPDTLNVKTIDQLIEKEGGQLISLRNAAEINAIVELPECLSTIHFVRGIPDNKLEEICNYTVIKESTDFAFIRKVAEVCIQFNEGGAEELRKPLTDRYDQSREQEYLQQGPKGIDAYHAWACHGGKGQNIQVIDIEGGWNLSHEDLDIQLLLGTNNEEYVIENHGTAVAGVICGKKNNFGITGIAHEAQFSAISIYPTGCSSAAILNAANRLQPGNVLLIELHRPGPNHNGSNGLIPVEWWPDDFCAIEYATDKGIVVIEAAGNGSKNLDDDIYNTPLGNFGNDWANPFNRSNADCGAIIVGAGASPLNRNVRDRSRLSFSNYGSCLDVQGWGEMLVSTGYGNLGNGSRKNSWYTNSFGGTSGAASMIAGIVACIQGAYRANFGSFLQPKKIRELLNTNGHDQTSGRYAPKNQNIGKRPDLRLLLDQLKIKKKIP